MDCALVSALRWVSQSAIQVIAGDAIRKFAGLYRTHPHERLVGQEFECQLPFDVVEKQFIGDRYGEYLPFVPINADYVVQVPSGRPDDYYWWLRSGEFNRVNSTTPNEIGVAHGRRDSEKLLICGTAQDFRLIERRGDDVAVRLPTSRGNQTRIFPGRQDTSPEDLAKPVVSEPQGKRFIRLKEFPFQRDPQYTARLVHCSAGHIPNPPNLQDHDG